MTLQLLVLILLLVAATTAAVWVRIASNRPVNIAQRVGGKSTRERVPLFLAEPGTGILARLGVWLNDALPPFLMTQHRAELLAQAGFTVPTAPALYVVAQIASVIGLSLVMNMVVGFIGPSKAILGTIAGGVLGFAIPSAFVARRRERWQKNIRKAIPDALDLLLVCVEAGVSLDTAILRVGRELMLAHPELANEFLIINRKQNAGIPREEALRGLWERTGLDELRTLVGNIVQSERWGTSISRVLRIESEVLRRQRRTAAERRAAVVSTKMLLPLALLILPALFAVVGGPAIIQVQKVFDAMPAQ